MTANVPGHILSLLSLPGSQVNLERRGDHYRLRYRELRADGSVGQRKGLELPADMVMVATIRELVEERRRNRRAASGAVGKWYSSETPRELDSVLNRMLAACQRGRVMRRRIRLVFRIAAELGYETLLDFIKRRPWLAAKPMPAGRPRKRSYTNCTQW